MEPESFACSLNAFFHHRPFESFTAGLSSGEQITVDHAAALVYRGGLALDGASTLFDHVQVTRMIGMPDNQSAAA